MRDLPPLPPTHTRPMKLNTLVTLMVYSVTGAILLVIFVLYFAQITRATRDGVRDTALAVARTLADSPAVIRGLALPPDSNIIQPVALTVMQRRPRPGGQVEDPGGVPDRSGQDVVTGHGVGEHRRLRPGGDPPP